jgi:microcystin-dependent protein
MSALNIGWAVAGTGFLAESKIVSVTNATTVVLDKAATFTQAGTGTVWLCPFGNDTTNNTSAFNVPDLRSRAIFGVGAVGRITNTGTDNSGINGQVLGAAGGDQRMHQHTHTQNSHSHSLNRLTWAGGTTGSATIYNTRTNEAFSVNDGTAGTTATNNNTGTGGSQNMPPTIILNYIIKI